MTAKNVISRDSLLPLGLALALAGGAYTYGKQGTVAETDVLKERVAAVEKRVDDIQARQDRADERIRDSVEAVRADLGQIKERLGIVEATRPPKQ